MPRAWTSQPPGLVAVRLNVDLNTREKLNELAGAANVSMSQFVRRIVETVVQGGAVKADALVAELKKEQRERLAGSGLGAGLSDPSKTSGAKVRKPRKEK